MPISALSNTAEMNTINNCIDVCATALMNFDTQTWKNYWIDLNGDGRLGMGNEDPITLGVDLDKGADPGILI